jgi:multiple sugar transport system permease protein
MTKHEWQNVRNGLLFVLPWLIGMSAFTLIPTGMAFYYSLCDYNVLNSPVYIGTGNYTDLVTDGVFWVSLKNTAWFAIFALPLGTLLSLALAMLLNCKIIARPFFRTIFFLPALVPLVALAILWTWIFHGRYGVLNHVLSWVGINGPSWLGSTTWAKPAMVIATLWGVGNAIVIYLAGLQDIPKQYYEAAKIDGASWWQQMVHITFPMLSPVIYFNFIMGCIGVLQIFVLPYVMTQGGPARSTYFYTMYLFDHAFVFLNMGYACAMAIVLFGLIAIMTTLAHKLTIKHVHYGGN